MTTVSKPFSIGLWGSEPLTNDDCHTGDDYATRKDAEKDFEMVVSLLERGEIVWHCHNTDTEYVVLDGPGVHLEIRIKSFVCVKDDCSDWDNEFAMQNGMAFGVQGYNDAMGY